MNNPNNKSSLNREDLGGSPYGSSNILIRITGQDRPGLTASIMEILAKYDTQILDIGQADSYPGGRRKFWKGDEGTIVQSHRTAGEYRIRSYH